MSLDAAITRERVSDQAAAASLNLSTYIALYSYGYRNIYELAPLIDIKTSKLQFESSPRAK